MPKLKAFGRLWPISSEDLFFPAVSGLGFSCIWVLDLLFAFAMHLWKPSCAGAASHYLHLFYLGALILGVLYVGLNAALVYTTTRGTTINYWPRRRIVPILKFRIVLDIVRLCSTLWSTNMVFFEDLSNCGVLEVTALKSSIWLAWAVTGLGICTFPYVLCPLFTPIKRTKPRRQQLHRRNSFKDDINTIANGCKRHFLKRWRALKQYFNINLHPAIDGADASVLDYFWLNQAEDVSPSDVLAGLILYQREQKKQWKATLDEHFNPGPNATVHPQKSEQLPTQPLCNVRRESLDVLQEEGSGEMALRGQPWMTAQNALYYQKYAKASYGWPKYVMGHGLAGAWRLCKRLCGTKLDVPNPSNIVCDSPWYLNTRTIQMNTGLEIQDLVYVSFFHKWAEIPFFVGLDHYQKKVVVAIRGTTSFDDIVTDVNVYESEDLDVDGVSDTRVHEGMLLAARCLKQKLTGLCDMHKGQVQVECLPEKPILDMAFEQLDDIPGVNPQEYSLAIVGHSLGASVAAVVAVLLQQEEKYKDLICFSYGPVAGLLSPSLARHSESFVCSVVVQDDIVSRAHKTNAYDLKIGVLQTIRDCDIPKHVIFANVWKRLLFKCLAIPCPDMKIAIRRKSWPSWRGERKATRLVKKFKGKLDDTLTLLELKRDCFPEMIAPGCIMFIRVFNDEQGQSPQYKSIFIRGDSPLLQEIQITPKMFEHHSLKYQKKALAYLSMADHLEASRVPVANGTA